MVSRYSELVCCHRHWGDVEAQTSLCRIVAVAGIIEESDIGIRHTTGSDGQSVAEERPSAQETIAEIVGTSHFVGIVGTVAGNDAMP